MIVGLDLGGYTGFAVLDEDGNRVFSTSWNLGKRTPKSSLHFHELLCEKFAEYYPSVVGYEWVGQLHRSRAAAVAWGSWEGILWITCEQLGIKVEKVNVMAVKKLIGVPNANKEDSEVYVFAKHKYITQDDNESDAIIIAECTRLNMIMGKPKGKR